MAIEESTPAKLKVEEACDAYARLAPLCALWEALAEPRARIVALEFADVRGGEAVLEVGTGSGSALDFLARSNPGGLTVGIDRTTAMLRRTQRRFFQGHLLSVPLCQADARLLPFGDSSFDLVFSAYVLDLLSTTDIETTLREMRRVLRPSGRLVLTHLAAGDVAFDRTWALLYAAVPMLLGGCRPIRVAQHLPSAGFSVVQIHRITQWGIPAEAILAKRES
ncbi:MAG: class I SAM-dependent methyltransferase [Acidobacteria bacterium]|nr:class I SAM-dependent methyltransferase [Acidobacteriota bacterium]